MPLVRFQVGAQMLKKATHKDLEAIKSLIDWGAGVGRVLPRPLDEIRLIVDSFYVWVEEEEIVGCCSLEVYSKKLAEIRSLVVKDSHQNKGIGRKLVQACMEEAKAKNIYEVLTITDRDSFFGKLGFSTCLNGQYAMFLRPE